MKYAAARLVAVFATYTGLMVLAKVLFLCCYTQPGWGATQWLGAIWHGLPMDMSTAGYLSVLPGLMLAAETFAGRPLRLALRIYFGVVAVVLAAIIVLDLALYGYWNFRLDATPLYYLVSSPGAAMASVEWWQAAVGAVGIALAAWGIYAATKAAGAGECTSTTPKWKGCVLTVFLTALLLVPIRGSLTVATMNLSRAYFSTDRRLNHAAVDPAFSLLYSLTHAGNFSSMYRFMDDAEATAALGRLDSMTVVTEPDSTRLALTAEAGTRPDIYLLILESVSAHLMPSLGGDSVAMRLDSIAAQGLLFTDFYASSFRTDRAMPAILNAFTAQPSTSLTRYVDKLDRLPALGTELKKHGYATSYYYGGDPNFCNMRALVVNGGVDRLVHDTDFPLAERASKWGVDDGNLTRRVLADISALGDDAPPQYVVVQQSSSHEPFDVPYANVAFAGQPARNAFAYSDSCLAELVRGIGQSPRGRKALILIVPDHLGAWPLGLEDAAARHHVPFVITGPALASPPARIPTVAAQTDIAPTVLAALGMDHSMFPMGRDLFDPDAPRYVFFSEPGMAAMVTATDTVVLDTEAGRVLQGSEGPLTQATRAYLQRLYNRIADL